MSSARPMLLPWLLLVASISGLALLIASAGAAEARFVDVSQQTGLTFMGEVGPTFPEVTDEILRIMQRNMGSGAAVGDFDGDGDLDVYLLGHAGRANVLYRNDMRRGRVRFTDVTPPGLGDLGLSRVAHFADLDGDGDLDLLVVNDDDGATAGPSRIFRNDRRFGRVRFTDVTPGSGFRPIGYLHAGVALADYDGDGRLDVLVTRWGAHGPTGPAAFPGRTRLYRNLGCLRFEEVTDAVGLGGLTEDGFSAIFADFDADGDPDLHLAVDHTEDRFFRNEGGVFADVGVEVGIAHRGNDMGVAAADFDDDGDLDLYSTNITDPARIVGNDLGNVLYVNQLAETGVLAFEDQAAARGVDLGDWGWGTAFVDVENDGDLDLVAVTGFDEFLATQVGGWHPLIATPSLLFVNDGTGRFERQPAGALDQPWDSRALVPFDFDRDGDRDLLVTNVGGPALLLENVTRSQGHWLDVALSPDPLAIGAHVIAEVGGIARRRDVVAGRSYLAGTPSEVHFGLGSARRVDVLRVVWADGREDVWRGVRGDRLLHLDRRSRCGPACGLGFELAPVLLGLGLVRQRRRR